VEEKVEVHDIAAIVEVSYESFVLFGSRFNLKSMNRSVISRIQPTAPTLLEAHRHCYPEEP
jgi:hypothetical protein